MGIYIWRYIHKYQDECIHTSIHAHIHSYIHTYIHAHRQRHKSTHNCCMCVMTKLYNMMFTFTTVCTLDCNNHGNATSDCLKCTCDPNWGGSTCVGMNVETK